MASRIDEPDLFVILLVDEEGEKPGVIDDLDTEILGRLPRRGLPLARLGNGAVVPDNEVPDELIVVLG